MSYRRIVISSGHGKYVPGAIGILDEHAEAVCVVDTLSAMLVERGVEVTTFEDTVSKTQNENLNRIVDFHNSQTRDLDVSIHFNAYVETDKQMGTECLYVTQSGLAREVADAVASCGFINRGPKCRTDLFFLNNTAMPAILIEVCFVDSEADARLYNDNFEDVCDAIADVLGGIDEDDWPTPPPLDTDALFRAQGTVSYFGGPDDMGVSASEGLAFISEIDQAPQLFLPSQPSGTTGLARRLNPWVPYVACRWDYSVTPKAMMLEGMALVRSTKTGIAMRAFPADWGPNQNTGRVADISPGLMEALGIETDDEVEVIFPIEGG
jgi:N-acetylmuramoyl-L-alanine amidase